MRLLRINSSARRSSISRDLTAKYTEAWKKEHPEGEVVELDLATTSLPLVTDEWTQAAYTDPSKRTPAQQQALFVSDALIDELVSADTIVIGVPMYNFSIPSSLKAWIDQVVRVGKTVNYGANGPKGLISGKKVVVITSRGGAYPGNTPRARIDFQEPYLRHILGFIGLTEVTFIHAENQLSDLAEPSRAAALRQIEQVVTQSVPPL